MTDVTKEFHRVRPKRYLSLWYVKNNPCTYVTSTLTPFANGSNEIPQDPRHLEVASGASKTISKTMVRLAQTVHLSYINTNTITQRYLSLWYVQRKPCTYLTSTLTPYPNEPNEIPRDPRHQGVPLGVSKTISEPMVHLAQTVHLSYINTNTISKRTERDST